MPSTPRTLAQSVTRIRPTFEDDIGNHKGGTGTGFWLDGFLPRQGKSLSSPVLVTNKHMLDPRLKYPKLPGLRLTRLEIEHGPRERGTEPPVKFYDLPDLSAIYVHPTADCAIILGQDFCDTHDIEPKCFHAAYLARREWLRWENNLDITDTVHFVGYPGEHDVIHWDETTGLPIARVATIASIPQQDHKHPGIPTTDAVLVSGMSFGGSSGSPVVSSYKYEYPPLEIGDPSIKDVDITIPHLVGIMSGHFRTVDRTEEYHPLLRHTGLSYFTRSNVIECMLEEICRKLAEEEDSGQNNNGKGSEREG